MWRTSVGMQQKSNDQWECETVTTGGDTCPFILSVIRMTSSAQKIASSKNVVGITGGTMLYKLYKNNLLYTTTDTIQIIF